MRNKQQIQREASAIIRELAVTYPQLANIPLRVSGRMTSAAGKAVWKGGLPYEIVLSLPFFANEANDLHRTTTHEAAHIVAGIGVGHGPTWKAIHRQMGGKGDRCHTMSLSEGYKPRKRTARVQVSCGCGCGMHMRLGPTQLRKHKSGQANYMLAGHKRPPYIF